MLNNIHYRDEILHDDVIKRIIGEHKTNSISNVEEEQLETILDIIHKSNPGFVFKMIQYSRKNKELIFYTDKDLSLKKYFEYYEKLPNQFQYKKLSSKENVLNEIKDILNSDINTDSDCISLYDVLLLIRKTKYDLDQIKKGYESQLNYKFHYVEPYTRISVHEFNYIKNELEIAYYNANSYDVNSLDIHTMIFSKKNNDLVLNGTADTYEYKIFSKLGDILLNLYNEFENYRFFYEQDKCNLRPVNSNLFIDIDSYGIEIKDSNDISERNHLTITANSYINHYDNKSNSHNLLNVIVGYEDEIFKRIFIKISDCPEWSQPLLTNIRKEQLEEMRRIEENNKTRELNRKKRQALLKRLCPFIQWT